MVAVLLVRSIAAGLLAPIALHLVIGPASHRLLVALYSTALVASVARGLSETGIYPNALAEFTQLPAALLAVCSVAGLLHLRRTKPNAERRWNLVLLAVLALAALGDVALPGIAEGLPDYLLVALFLLHALLSPSPAVLRFPGEAGRLAGNRRNAAIRSVFVLAGWTPWTRALLLTPLWLAGPPLFALLNRTIDRVWLGRRYSAAEAEHLFLRESPHRHQARPTSASDPHACSPTSSAHRQRSTLRAPACARNCSAGT